MENIVIDKVTDWGGNFKLHIQSKEIKDNSYVYTVCSLYEENEIGFELQIPTDIKTFGEGVIFKSLGNISDNFIKALFSIYGLYPQNNLKFVDSISFNYTGLNDLVYKSDGQKRLSHINYVKVFLEGNGEDEYAELYVNIDENNETIEFEEKEYEYRPYVAMLLSVE
ncbi:MAG: hypothetical protein JWR61_1105 [Ferruginibacter sp.]|uniref:hypothetical protein n=1 Tax=Ferruginibacter sp. TaxID=1940288 RepID=UPI0026588C90|nr:hypothetical protein [Ferruginibacter sp.]MDB5276150.1 hypothetical protein [Ferruginibacter sp.]